MNKLFIILLAIGLASAHTFVKRDAPAAASTENYIDLAKNKFGEFADNVKTLIDPERIQKDFNEFVDKVKDATKNLMPKENKPQA